MTEYGLRALTTDDLPAVAGLLANAFLSDDRVEAIGSREGLLFEPERAFGAFADGRRLVGMAKNLSRVLTVPGRGPVPFSALTSVAVLPEHRRRGLLVRLMRASLPADGPAVSALWASEAAIYGRFGYGIAAEYVRTSVPTGARFRPGVDLGGTRPRELPVAEAEPLIRALYERYAPTRVGALGRTAGHWDNHLYDPAETRRGMSGYRFAVHPEGYAVYRVRQGWQDRGADGLAAVHELVALTPRAHAALWRHLLDLDLIAWVEHDAAPDDPLPLLLTDPKQAVRKTSHGLHVRLVDVARALPMRGYSAPADLVVAVADEFCPWNAGRLRITISGGAATVARTDREPDVSTSSAELGAAFLGGVRLTALAAAGRVQEHSAGAVTALSAAFAGEREPAALEVF